MVIGTDHGIEPKLTLPPAYICNKKKIKNRSSISKMHSFCYRSSFRKISSIAHANDVPVKLEKCTATA